jgi:hypothetical protein
MDYIGEDKVLLFGGWDGSNYKDDTWVYDLSENKWTNKETEAGGWVSGVSKPSARCNHAMAYIGGDRVLLFGGGLPLNNETWVYDLSENTWTQKSPSSKPSPRDHHAMAYISDGKVLFFGGWDGSTTYSDTWVYDINQGPEGTWTQKSPSSKPSARCHHAMAYIGVNKALLFGGSVGVNGDRNDETWVYDLSGEQGTWTQKSPSSKPSARYHHDMAYIGGDKVLLFGGWDDSGFDDETWVYYLSGEQGTWTQDGNITQPSARYDHGLSETSMDGSSYLVLFGGYNGSSLDDTWTFGGGDYFLGINISADCTTGDFKNNFSPGEDVCGKTTGLSLTDGTYPLYVVATKTWTSEENQTIPPRISGTGSDPEIDIQVVNGNIQKDVGGTPEDIWVSPPDNERAQYDIVVDINKDENYDPLVDLLDADQGVDYGFSLPVELSSFTATTGDGTVTLRWRTETEVNNIGFAIYRSEEKDGNYIRINFVPGAGSSAMPNEYQFTDKKVEQGKTYFYYLEDVDIAGEKNRTKIIKVVVPPAKPIQPIPKEFRLLQNFPNPFNPDTWLPYELAADAPVSIEIYNIQGQLVRQLNIGKQKAGSYITKDKAIHWDGKNERGEKVASGNYWYRLRAGEFNATRRMVILK